MQQKAAVNALTGGRGKAASVVTPPGGLGVADQKKLSGFSGAKQTRRLPVRGVYLPIYLKLQAAAVFGKPGADHRGRQEIRTVGQTVATVSRRGYRVAILYQGVNSLPHGISRYTQSVSQLLPGDRLSLSFFQFFQQFSFYTHFLPWNACFRTDSHVQKFSFLQKA